MKSTKEIILCNVGTGTHDGTLTLRATAPIAAHTAIRITTEGEASPYNDESTEPHAISLDEATTGEYLAVALLGAAPSTLKILCSANVSAGTAVYLDDDGKGKSEPSAPGSYYQIGLALHAANAGELVEIDPRPAVPFTVGE